MTLFYGLTLFDDKDLLTASALEHFNGGKYTGGTGTYNYDIIVFHYNLPFRRLGDKNIFYENSGCSLVSAW